MPLHDCRGSVALIAVLVCAGADWLRLTTPHVEILTDAGEKSARATLDRFEQIRSVFPQPAESHLRVFVFASDREFRAYTDSAGTGGFYQSGTERDYVVLPSGGGLSRAVAHEYVHLVMNHATPLPLWFEEGTAELYSNLTFDRRGLYAGEPIREHLATLAGRPWLTADQLASATRASSFYNERDPAGVFYAQSWALAHMLNLAPGWRENMPRYAELLADGREDAFREAFGRSFEQAVSELRGYLPRMRGVTLGASTRAAPAGAIVSRVPPLEALWARADLALHIQHAALARSLVKQAEKSEPDSPDTEAMLGALALAEDRRADARTHLQKAVATGNRDAEICFQLAMLERDAGAPRERVGELLSQTLTLDPDFAPAHLLLGDEAAAAGDYTTAIAHFRQAVRVRPRDASLWNALADAQARLGQAGEARQSALRAIRNATTPEQERMGQALLDSLR